jgi:hypothetical protein
MVEMGFASSSRYNAWEITRCGGRDENDREEAEVPFPRTLHGLTGCSSANVVLGSGHRQVRLAHSIPTGRPAEWSAGSKGAMQYPRSVGHH